VVTLARYARELGPDGQPYLRYWSVKAKRLVEVLERDEQSLSRILDGLDAIEADHADRDELRPARPSPRTTRRAPDGRRACPPPAR
jgi:hypothetical protein